MRWGFTKAMRIQSFAVSFITEVEDTTRGVGRSSIIYSGTLPSSEIHDHAVSPEADTLPHIKILRVTESAANLDGDFLLSAR